MAAMSCDRCAARARGVFCALSARPLGRLMAAHVPHRYAPGQQLCFQGNAAFAVFCIQEGRVKLSRLAPDGEEHVISVRNPGEIVGHRAVLLDGFYRASAVSIEPSTVCAIPRAAFMDLLRENSDFANAVLMQMARASLDTEDRLMARAMERVQTRLARFLLEHLPEPARAAQEPLVIRLELKRQEVARLVDTTPATLSHTLHVLAQRGVIAPRGREIRVLDRTSLERIARLRPAAEGSAGRPG